MEISKWFTFPSGVIGKEAREVYKKVMISFFKIIAINLIPDLLNEYFYIQ